MSVWLRAKAYDWFSHRSRLLSLEGPNVSGSTLRRRRRAIRDFSCRPVRGENTRVFVWRSLAEGPKGGRVFAGANGSRISLMNSFGVRQCKLKDQGIGNRLLHGRLLNRYRMLFMPKLSLRHLDAEVLGRLCLEFLRRVWCSFVKAQVVP